MLVGHVDVALDSLHSLELQVTARSERPADAKVKGDVVTPRGDGQLVLEPLEES